MGRLGKPKGILSQKNKILLLLLVFTLCFQNCESINEEKMPTLGHTLKDDGEWYDGKPEPGLFNSYSLLSCSDTLYLTSQINVFEDEAQLGLLDCNDVNEAIDFNSQDLDYRAYNPHYFAFRGLIFERVETKDPNLPKVPVLFCRSNDALYLFDIIVLIGSDAAPQFPQGPVSKIISSDSAYNKVFDLESIETSDDSIGFRSSIENFTLSVNNVSTGTTILDANVTINSQVINLKCYHDFEE